MLLRYWFKVWCSLGVHQVNDTHHRLFRRGRLEGQCKCCHVWFKL